MIIICQKCKTRFNLSDDLIKQPEFIVRCSKCNYIFTAYRFGSDQNLPFLNLEKALKKRTNNNIITVSNQKGGVAKTSTCLNLGVSLTLQKKKVLLIDFDVQANLTLSLGVRNKKSFFDLINKRKPAPDTLILETKYPGLWLMPSNKKLVLLNKKFFGHENFEYLLKDRLNYLKEKFDYIIIDTPPSIEFFTLNALTASSFVIIPTQCDYLSTHGVDRIIKIIQLIKQNSNHVIHYKVLITMYDEKSTASRLIYTKLQEMYKKSTFKTLINFDQKIKEAQIMNIPVHFYDQKALAGTQYLQLAKEISA